MGDVFVELVAALRSKPRQEKITPAEELYLHNCQSKALRSFTIGFCASSVAMWAATWKLAKATKINMCISSALIFGYWGRNRALSECVDQIITIDGSRIQNELATIILSKHENNTSLMKLVSKHYYSEWVYNDLNQDKPILRWRPRDAYGDNTDAFKKTELENSSNDNKRNVYVDSTVASKKIELENSSNGNKHNVYVHSTAASQKTELENSSNGNKRNICPNQSTQSQSSLPGDMIADPLECLFDFHESTEEINKSINDELPTLSLRAQKKANRRRCRARRSETSHDN